MFIKFFKSYKFVFTVNEKSVFSSSRVGRDNQSVAIQWFVPSMKLSECC